MSEPVPMIPCWHPSIQVIHDSLHDTTFWSCYDCGRRFYPACEECVSIGHRGGHGEHPKEANDD